MSLKKLFVILQKIKTKLDELTQKELKANIDKVIIDIPKPKEMYENIIKGT